MPLYEYVCRRAARPASRSSCVDSATTVACPSCSSAGWTSSCPSSPSPRPRPPPFEGCGAGPCGAMGRAAGPDPAAAGPAACRARRPDSCPATPSETRSAGPRRGAVPERRERQHREGKLTARERVDILLDDGSFEELDQLVEHRCLDFGMAEQKDPGRRCRLRLWPRRRPAGLRLSPRTSPFSAEASPRRTPGRSARSWTSPSKRAPPSSVSTTRAGPASRKGWPRSPATPTSSSATPSPPGSCPRSRPSWVRAPGGRSTAPAITDFNVMVKDTSCMFVTGPDVIRTVTHEEVTKEELGGAMTHNAKSGVAHFAVDDDRACLAFIRELLSYLPSNNLEPAPTRPSSDPPDREDPALETLVPLGPLEALRHEAADRGGRGRGAVLRGPRALRPEHRRRLRPASGDGAWESWATSPPTSPAASTSTPR